MGHRDQNYDPNLPSVTELLEEIGYYDEYPDKGKEYYFKRGNWVESVCNLIGHGLVDRTFDLRPSLSAILRNNPDWDLSKWPGFSLAFRNWMKQYPDSEMLYSQKYVRNDSLKYQGTLDQFWLFDWGTCLVELKCTDGAPPKHAHLQTAGYDIANDERSKKRLVLALHSDGSFDEAWGKYQDFDYFRSIVDYHWKHVVGKEYR